MIGDPIISVHWRIELSSHHHCFFHFLDRKKNIIRPSGENIPAAEAEATLLAHPDVQQAAVMAV